MELSEGQIIEAEFLAGPARVQTFKPRRSFYQLDVTFEETGEFRRLQLSEDQLRQIQVAQQDPAALSSDPESFFLMVEAMRIRLAHQFDPMMAVGVSQVDPLPHQIEAVYEYALESPRLRFLVADDPGAGKTVMAGLIFKEMHHRRLIKRVLIVAPGHLKYQWQREMKEKFNASFKLIDRSMMRAAWAENIWEEQPLAITSLDFLKQDDIKATLQGSHWDLVIVDEAHKMSATTYQTKDEIKTDKTKRYHVGEILSRNSNHLLFLTATPHSGDQERFRLFLDLLRPGFFAKKELLEESVDRGENPLFIRRLKEDMRTFDGQPIFPPRHVQTVSFEMTDAERTLYENVTRFVQNYYDQAKENRSITFALMILQRRLTSSVHAVLNSLERRKARLEELKDYPQKLQADEQFQAMKAMDEDEWAELSEEDRWEYEQKLEKLTIARNVEDLNAEIEQIEQLIEDAQRVRSQEVESKLVKLRDEILSVLGDRKLLIFTEHKDTLWYLVEKLGEWGYAVNYIHGGMSLDARIEAEHVFRDESQIMVATEAAGEGINLQFCSLMVNYDIPWNPNRLEQRMGRVHRYGQTRDVRIWNMVSKDAREGQILEKLFDKLDQMQAELGTDRVFDVIGDVVPDTNLSDLFKGAIFDQRHMDEIEAPIDQIDSTHVEQTLESLFARSLATRDIDYTSLHRRAHKAEEHRLVPEYVADFTLRGLSHFGGQFTPLETGYRIDSVPFEIRHMNEDYDFKTAYGQVRRHYPRVTFDKRVAKDYPKYEFVAPGHPLLEGLNEAILQELQQPQGQYAVFADPEGQREGTMWFVQGEVRDGLGDPAGRRVFCLRQQSDGTIQSVNPAILWDLNPAEDAQVPEAIRDQLHNHEAIEEHAYETVLSPYRDEIAERRERDAQIKEKYGLRSLEYLISESDGKLLDYQMRADAGQDMGLVIRNEQANYEALQKRKADLEREIRLERNLTVEAPKILGVAAVVPQAAPSEEPEPAEEPQGAVQPTRAQPSMVQDEEVEQVGMDVSRAYEEAHGWEVVDVSEEPHGGFDLRSTRIDEQGRVWARYIEVKARARSGAIELTANEWKRARHFGDDYWLYIVTDAATENPQLKRIQNPASHFQEGEDIFATRLRVPEDRWQQHADSEQEASSES